MTSKKGKGNAVMTGGSVMMGAIITNKSAVSLDNVTPLARLTGEYGVLVVPAASPIKSVQDLVAKLKADPGSVSWGGGSAGGTDQILAGLIAKSAGVEATKVNYIAHAGGGEALSSILGGHVTVGVSGWQEFAPQVAAGKLRAIGIAAPERVPGIDVPTLKEQGVDVELVNWRAVFAPPGISDDDQADAVRDGRQDGRRAAVAGHAQGARLARALQAARRVRGVRRRGQETVTATLKDVGLVK